MRVDTHVTCSPTEGFALPIWNVLFRLWVAVLLGHTKINDMDYCISSVRSMSLEARLIPTVRILGSWSTNQEVIWLDIPIDEVLFVNCLNASDLRVTDGREGHIDELGSTVCVPFDVRPYRRS